MAACTILLTRGAGRRHASRPPPSRDNASIWRAAFRGDHALRPSPKALGPETTTPGRGLHPGVGIASITTAACAMASAGQLLARLVDEPCRASLYKIAVVLAPISRRHCQSGDRSALSRLPGLQAVSIALVTRARSRSMF